MKNFTSNMNNIYENTNDAARSYFSIQHQPGSITNEEAKNLNGMVAKTRALFECNQKTDSTGFGKSKSFYKTNQPMDVSNRTTAIKQSVSANNVSQFSQNKFNNVVRNLGTIYTDKENESCVPRVPFLNQIKSSTKLANRFSTRTNLAEFNVNHSDSGGGDEIECGSSEQFSIHSSHSSIGHRQPQEVSNGLWSSSEETSRELNLPISVKQAKLCFESLANLNNKNTVNAGSRQQPQTKSSRQTISNMFQTSTQFKHLQQVNIFIIKTSKLSQISLR